MLLSKRYESLNAPPFARQHEDDEAGYFRYLKMHFAGPAVELADAWSFGRGDFLNAIRSAMRSKQDIELVAKSLQSDNLDRFASELGLLFVPPELTKLIQEAKASGLEREILKEAEEWFTPPEGLAERPDIPLSPFTVWMGQKFDGDTESPDANDPSAILMRQSVRLVGLALALTQLPAPRRSAELPRYAKRSEPVAPPALN